MSFSFRRDLFFLIPFCVCLVAFVFLPDTIRGIAALLAGALAFAHGLTGDEVVRQHAARAAALAFAVSVLAALAVPLFEMEAVLESHARFIWAGLFALYIGSWLLTSRRWF
ncbi:hypothetical protein [Hyphobacterium sp.]|uniref:hypothetical protein n=1 Tax=Hyphobacterium sp. TaxID=2004662 RepID=UPI003BACD68E